MLDKTNGLRAGEALTLQCLIILHERETRSSQIAALQREYADGS